MKHLLSSTDIYFSAYLLMKGIKMVRHEKISHNKVRCFFELDEETWGKYKNEMINSDIGKIKSFVEQIKDLAF